jgi:hypothetical protein
MPFICGTWKLRRLLYLPGLDAQRSAGDELEHDGSPWLEGLTADTNIPLLGEVSIGDGKKSEFLQA